MTTLDSFSSIVKYSRDQSTLSPRRRIWLVMVAPLVAFQSHTCATKFLRPRSWRERPVSCSWRSTTICVAMPAWSVPGTHSVLKPRMRWYRVSASMMVWLNAWPMCSVPVTLGGGSWMQNEGLLPSSVGAAAPAAAHTGPQRASMAAGSKDLASSVMVAATIQVSPGRVSWNKANQPAWCTAAAWSTHAGCQEL